jgi:dTDP-4-amino-4,6-dideoxygalactose transaminase
MSAWPPPLPEGVLEEKRRIAIEGPWTAGRWTAVVESFMCDMARTTFAVAFPSCSIAIHASMLALGATHRTRVLAPDFTFIGTLAGALQSGSRVVFADVDDNLNIDDEYIAANANGKLRVAELAIPVDLHGVPHLFPREEVRGVPVINDACQALGTRFHGKHLGEKGIHCWSFSPAKAAPSRLGGGCVTTDSADVAIALTRLRNYGREFGEEKVLMAGQNWWPSEETMLECYWALGNMQVWAERMHEVGEELRDAIVAGGQELVQRGVSGARIAWHKIRVHDPCGLPYHRWGTPLHSHPAFKASIRQINGYPRSEAAAETVCLGTEKDPFWTWSVDRVAAAVRSRRER